MKMKREKVIDFLKEQIAAADKGIKVQTTARQSSEQRGAIVGNLHLPEISFYKGKKTMYEATLNCFLEKTRKQLISSLEEQAREQELYLSFLSKDKLRIRHEGGETIAISILEGFASGRIYACKEILNKIDW